MKTVSTTSFSVRGFLYLPWDYGNVLQSILLLPNLCVSTHVALKAF